MFDNYLLIKIKGKNWVDEEEILFYVCFIDLNYYLLRFYIRWWRMFLVKVKVNY